MKNIILLLILSVKIYAQTPANNLINGVFIVNQTKYYDGVNCNFNQLKTANNIAAYFTYTPTTNIPVSAFSKAGNVKFNNKPLNYNNNDKFYSETEIPSINQQNWKVSGHNMIPNMNFIFNGVMPFFNINQSLLPDTIKKSDTLFVNFNTIQNADSIIIRVTDDSRNSSPNTIILMAPNYANTYYLPSSFFSPLSCGPRSCITIDAIKYSYQTISGKRFLFRNIYSFVKTNVKIIN